jgi:hypothetical protein
MERNNFVYKSHCELAIVSHEISLDFLTGELGIVPERTFRKGEQSVSKHSGSIITKPHNLWAIKSKASELEEETISHHIEYFKSTFLSKVEILKKYKEDTRFELTFWVWIETDNAGIGFDLNETEMSFINSISNRVHVSLIAKTEDTPLAPI